MTKHAQCALRSNWLDPLWLNKNIYNKNERHIRKGDNNFADQIKMLLHCCYNQIYR